MCSSGTAGRRLHYEEALAGRYSLLSSPTPERASTAQVVMAYRRLLEAERRFPVLSDFLRLRPVFHWTEDGVGGNVAVYVVAPVVKALMAADWGSPLLAIPISTISTSPRRGPFGGSAAPERSPSMPASGASKSWPAARHRRQRC